MTGESLLTSFRVASRYADPSEGCPLSRQCGHTSVLARCPFMTRSRHWGAVKTPPAKPITAIRVVSRFATMSQSWQLPAHERRRRLNPCNAYKFHLEG